MIALRLSPICIFSSVIFAFVIHSTFASTDTISLKSCIEIALKSNPQLLVSKGNNEAYLAGYETARSSLLPQLSLSSGANRGGTDSTVNNGNYSAGVSARMQLYDFGKTYAKTAGSERSFRAAESDAVSVRQNVLLSVCTAYYNCLAAAALRKVGIESLKLSETHREQAAILLEAGRGVKYNVIVAEVDVENNRLALIKAENAVEACRTTLVNALGTVPADTLVFRDTLTEALDFSSLEYIRKTAFENQPEVKSARLRREAAQKSVTAALCSRYPAITSSAGAGVQSPVTRIDWHETWDVGVALSLPLYEGGAISAAIRQAKGSLMAAEGNLAIAEQNVSLDIEQQYQSIKEALASIHVAKKVVERSLSALAIAQERYKVGSGSPLEITNAELTFSNAKITYIQALTDLNNANVRLQRAMGTLSETFAK